MAQKVYTQSGSTAKQLRYTCCADIALQAEFVASEHLGRQEVKLEHLYDAVTCMFAIHYFFASKQSLDNFFHNVSINLKEGKAQLGKAHATPLSSVKVSIAMQSVIGSPAENLAFFEDL